MRNLIAESGLPLIYALPDSMALRAGLTDDHHSGTLRCVVEPLSGFQKQASVFSPSARQAWRFVSDEGESLNGWDAAPPPLGYFAAGLAAAYMDEISSIIGREQVDMRSLRVGVDTYYTMTGSMPRGTMIGAALPVELTVTLDSDLPDDVLSAAVAQAVATAPVTSLLVTRVPARFRLTLNDRRRDLMEPPQMAGPLMADPVDEGWLVASPPKGTDQLLVAMGRSPAPTGAGEPARSVAPGARLIHVGASGRYRSDGIKDITHHLYAPQGSSWTFQSMEALGGSAPRAPDAMSFVAAGIGFCLMTQLGGVFAARNLDVDRYAIVQDLRLPERQDERRENDTFIAALETDLHIHSQITGDTAKSCLEAAKRACFLHSLCAGSHKPRVRRRARAARDVLCA